MPVGVYVLNTLLFFSDANLNYDYLIPEHARDFLSIFGSHATCVKAAEIQTTRISVVVLLSCSATVVPGRLTSENFSFAGKSGNKNVWKSEPQTS
jgi:hypothetical protein